MLQMEEYPQELESQNQETTRVSHDAIRRSPQIHIPVRSACVFDQSAREDDHEFTRREPFGIVRGPQPHERHTVI